MTAPETPSDYETFVAQCFRNIGYKEIMPTNPNQKAWDICVVAPDGKKGAVQVRSRRSGSFPHVQYNRLSLYLTGPAGEEFDFGVNVVNTSFSKPTLTMLEDASPESEDKFVYGAIVRFPMGQIEWVLHSPKGDARASPPPPPAPEPPKTPPAFRVAVFTEKGGVGKTSVAAHLAGALVHLGRDAVLVDCDSQKNLSLLLGDGVNVRNRRGAVSTLVIENYEAFDEANYPRFFIIHDCAPNFKNNDPKIFADATDTVIPIVLSPLSVLGNAEVIGRTISQIREVNPEMHFHIVINQYEQSPSASGVQTQMLQFIRHWLAKESFAKDRKIKFYDPEKELAVRRSNIMLHWGMFLLSPGSEPRLAFETKQNGATKLLGDFLALAGAIEERFENE